MEEFIRSDLKGKRVLVTDDGPVANPIAAKEWGAYMETLAPLGKRI